MFRLVHARMKISVYDFGVACLGQTPLQSVRLTETLLSRSVTCQTVCFVFALPKEPCCIDTTTTIRLDYQLSISLF